MAISKVSVMNDKVTGLMATEFYNAADYLKNCMATTQTTNINLSDVDTDIKKTIEAHSKYIVSLNKKLDDHNSGI